MSAEGVQYMSFNVPDEVAAERGRIIAEHLKLKPYRAGLDLEFYDGLEDDDRFETADGPVTADGLYRSIVRKIAEKGSAR